VVVGVCCGTAPVAVGVCHLWDSDPGCLQLDTKHQSNFGKAEFSFCHKECDTGDSEDISNDAEDNRTETGPFFSYPASLAMDFLSCMVNFTKYHRSL